MLFKRRRAKNIDQQFLKKYCKFSCLLVLEKFFDLSNAQEVSSFNVFTFSFLSIVHVGICKLVDNPKAEGFLPEGQGTECSNRETVVLEIRDLIVRGSSLLLRDNEKTIYLKVAHKGFSNG